MYATKEKLADLLRKFPNWGEAAAYYERALRRKAILDNYGMTFENIDFDRWLELVSSDEKIEEWFGEPLRPYIIEELEDIDATPNS